MKSAFIVAAALLMSFGFATSGQSGINTGMLDYDNFYSKMLAHIETFNIKPENIKKVSLVEKGNGGRRGFGTVTSIEYWLRLDSCLGNVVVEVNVSGKITDSYSRGDCKIDRMKAFG